MQKRAALYSSTVACTEKWGTLDLQLDIAAGDGGWLRYDGMFGEYQDCQRAHFCRLTYQLPLRVLAR